jgi:hypothetical protein
LKKIIKEIFFNNIGLTCNFAEAFKVIAELGVIGVRQVEHRPGRNQARTGIGKWK